MTTQVQHRRGTAAEHTTFIGAVGEITYDTTDKRLVAHDGTTAGGIPLAKESEAASLPQALGTGDSPQFLGINVGHASDTTIARASAGNLTVEGNAIYRAGGTDVPVTDGGTGASDAATARTNLGLGSIATLASPLPIANGGTGTTTAALAFAALKQSATASATGVVELATSAEVTTGTDAVRAITPQALSGAFIYGSIPQNSISAAYTLDITDKNGHIFHPSADTTARIWTIPANASVAYSIGTTLTFINQNGAGVITIAITTDTLRLAGSGATGSRTLAANGIATAVKVTATEWIISGVGLT
jgi:hypothetical protein